MKNPTRIRAGAVAADGMERKRGAKKRERRKKKAVTTAVTPVLPPSTTPVEDSTKVVTVEVPSIAPTVVPTASAKRASLQLGIVPSSLIISALPAHPMRVPTVSNMSTKRNVNMTMMKSGIFAATSAKLNFMNVGAIDGGRDATPLNCVTPNGIPTIVVARIPMRIPPFTLWATSTAVITTPIRATIAEGLVMLRLTRVAPSTMIPAFWRPMNAMKRPIPTPMAFLRF